jgi:hypothetical protein
VTIRNKRKPTAYFASINPSNNEDPNIISPRLYENRKIVQAGLISDDKYINRSKVGVLADEIVFVDPYPAAYKARLANAYEFDSIVRTGIDTLVHYVLGRDFEPKLRPVTREKPREESEFDNILDPIIDESERENLMNYINEVDHTVKLKQVLRQLLVQKYVFGRSAALIERAGSEVNTNAELAALNFTEETPLHVKVLHSYYLSQNHYNVKTWEVEEIEYDNPNWLRDPSKPSDEQPALPIEDLIYFTHSDNNVVPNGWGYGMSVLQPILALSGANRRLNEKVLPELNTAAWCGSGIFKFTGMSSKQMANFVKSILPSTWKATNQEIDYIPIKLDFDGKFLLDQRDSNVKHIATQVRIPSFLINFEDVTNRSIGDRVSNIWQQGDLEFARDELRDQLWEFWYRRLMELYFRDRGEEFLHLKAKIIIEFQSIDFSNFFEKAIAGGNLVQNNIFTVDEVRELLGRPPFPEDQMEMIDNIEKYLLEHPEIAQMLQQGPGQQLAQQGQGGPIGQQGLGVNVNQKKIKKADFGSEDLINRVKRGVKQPKNFR